MAERLKHFDDGEGVVFIGKAQEKAPVFRTEKRRSPNGQSYPWIVRSTTMVNQYYIYFVDRDFGPLFLKLSSYFPYNAKLCLNGHEYAKQRPRGSSPGTTAAPGGIKANPVAPVAPIAPLASTGPVAPVAPVIVPDIVRAPLEFSP